MRQLYLVVSRLFQYSKLNESVKTMELIIINRGRQTEEEIKIEFDPSYKYQMIALTSTDIILEDSVMQIKRIPPRDEVSIILETTDKNFSKKNVASISSKTSKGKILEKIEEVPPNAGNVAIFIGFIIFTLFISWYSTNLYFKYKENNETSFANDVSRTTGWNNLGNYPQSSLASFYPNGKFPIVIKNYERVKNKVILSIELINNSDDWLMCYVKVISPAHDSNIDLSIYNSSVFDVMVAPKTTSKQSLSAYLPAKHSNKILFVESGIKYKNESFYNLEQRINIPE